MPRSVKMMGSISKRFDKDALLVLGVWGLCVATGDHHSWLTWLAGALGVIYLVLRAVRYE